jgi:hypothetical protein
MGVKWLKIAKRTDFTGFYPKLRKLVFFKVLIMGRITLFFEILYLNN